MTLKDIFKVSALPVVVASLCCLSPVVLVLLGVGTVGFASSLADTLYGEYKGYFRAAGLVLMVISLIMYFRRTKNICTLDQVKRRRNEIINVVVTVFIAGVLGYVFFLYVAVHFVGVWLSLWE